MKQNKPEEKLQQQAEKILSKYNNIEWIGEGVPVYSAEQMIAAMVEMYQADIQKEKL